jgi:glycerophosphoryl diester phosphodiesterase
MKKLVVAITVLLLLSGCDTLSKQNDYLLDNDNISFSLPKAWEKSSDTTNDLAFTKSSANMGMIIFKKAEIEDNSAEELLNRMIKEKMTEMSNHSLLKEYNANKTRDRIIYSKLYTANKDGIERQYFFNVMEFIGSDTYVYVLYEAKETYMKYNIDDIQRLLVRMKWNGEGKDLAIN